MEFKRPVFQALMQRFLSGTDLIQVISGPRQIGKTTLVKQLFEMQHWKGMYAIADGIQNDIGWIESQYNAAVVLQKQLDVPVILAIDEIQKIPNWSETVKRLYDQQRFNGEVKIHWVLLGSSHWLMQKGLSESLAGRFEQWNLTHWTYTELSEAFGISPEQYVYFGAYPGAIPMIDDEARWKSYVRQSLIETVINKDVLLMHTIEKPALLSRLFELGTLYSGQILSYTKMMGQLQEAKNTTTLAHYLKLLAQAGLLSGLDKFAMDLARKRSSSPKWQVMNNALLGALTDVSFEQSQTDKKRWGRMVESAIGAHLIAHAKDDLEIHYWNESNAEVDFVIQKGSQYIALEVKLSHDKVTGLGQFAKQFKPHKVYQLSDVGLTWQQLLTMDPRTLF
jgi:predicted AAA+ superfamily ATPase